MLRGGWETSPGRNAVSLLGVQRFPILAFFAVLLAGCAPSLEPRIHRRAAPSFADTARSRPRVVLVVPENRNRFRRPGDIQQMDDAPEVLRDALGRSLASLGCDLVPGEGVDRLVEQEFPGGRDLTNGQAARIGAELGGDYVVFGRLDAWARGSLFGRSTTVEFRLDVVDLDGNSLASLRHSGTAAQEDPADLANALAVPAADSLVAAVGGCAIGDR